MHISKVSAIGKRNMWLTHLDAMHKKHDSIGQSVTYHHYWNTKQICWCKGVWYINIHKYTCRCIVAKIVLFLDHALQPLLASTSTLRFLPLEICLASLYLPGACQDDNPWHCDSRPDTDYGHVDKIEVGIISIKPVSLGQWSHSYNNTHVTYPILSKKKWLVQQGFPYDGVLTIPTTSNNQG